MKLIRLRKRGPIPAHLFLAVALLLSLPALALAQGAKERPQHVFEGTLVVHHADDFEGGRSGHRYLLEQGEELIPLKLHGREPHGLGGARVRVAGEPSNGALEVDSLEVLSTSTPETIAAERRVAVILFNFRDDQSRPWTPEQVYASTFTDPASLTNYYLEASYGRIALRGRVLGWYTIGANNSGCSYTSWASAAKQAAVAAGENLSGIQHFVFIFPKASGCSWTALGEYPGDDAWLNGKIAAMSMAHEIGHNLGLHHANKLDCRDGGARVALSSNCTRVEYGDNLSVMGSPTRKRHFSAPHRGRLGWLASGSLQTVTASGTYPLSPLPNGTGVTGLRVRRSSGQYLYLEYRRPFGTSFDNFSSTDPAVNGVTIRQAGDIPGAAPTDLVDTTPATSSYDDAPLTAGGTLSDGSLSITTVSVSATGAVVQISFGGGGGGGGGDTTAPTAPPSFAASATSSSSVALSWGASTDDVGVAGYRVFRGGTLLETTTQRTYMDSGLASSTPYSYSVVAFDAAGNASALSTASATTPADAPPPPPPPPTDTAPPTAPGDLAAALGKGSKQDLSWSAASDDVGVAGYRVFRNGALLATVSGTSYAASRAPKNTGTCKFEVAAFDAAGNVGPPSAPVSIDC